MIRCPIELLQAEFKHSEHVRDLFQLFGDAAVTSSANRCVQCHAYNGTENLPMAPDDA
jgi:cytochrome c553